MKILLSDVVSQVENIRALQEISFPVKVSYKIKRLVDKLKPILETYNEKRTELVKKYGEENEDKSFSVKEENLKEFYKELSELSSNEEEVEFEKIKVSELGDIKLEAKLLVDFIFTE